MEANNRLLTDWLETTINGNLMLPRFQRKEAWKPKHVERFVSAMLQGRPLGVFLVLRVDPDNQPFKTRPISGMTTVKEHGSKCTEHLLDGQQRLTALLNVFMDTYEKHTYYVTRDPDDLDTLVPLTVKAVSKSKGGPHRDVVGNAKREFANGWIPLRILNPMRNTEHMRIAWRKEACAEPLEEEHIEKTIADLRSRIDKTTIPWLSLPQSTCPTDAIRIYIDTNRSAVNLSEYDISVAQLEKETGDSLQAFVGKVKNSIRELSELDDKVIGDLILKSECVAQGMKPTFGNYARLDYDEFNEAKEDRLIALKWTFDELNHLRIWKYRLLPTTVPLRVLPALYVHIPKHGTEHARAMRIIRRYLWCSFLTDRYDRQANDRLKVDYDFIVAALTDPTAELEIPALSATPPTIQEIKRASWPTSGRLSRGILVACCQGGARDIASNQEMGRDGFDDYHHIFPKAILTKLKCDPDRVVNCMLLTAHTNRKAWLQKLPGDFLRAMREDKVMQQSVPDTESAINARLATHLLPAEMLLRVKKKATKDVKKAYDQFADARARLIKARVDRLLKAGEIQ